MTKRSTTTDVESLTNSVFMQVERVFRDNGMGGAFHDQSTSIRGILLGVVGGVVVGHLKDASQEALVDALTAKVKEMEDAKA